MFGSFNYTQETLEEHDRYAPWIGAWCMISGFGEYVSVDKELKPGEGTLVMTLVCAAPCGSSSAY